MDYTLTTKLFGKIEVSAEDGFFDDVEDVKNKRSFHLDIFDEVQEEKDFSKIVELLDAYHELDQQAKKFIFQEYHEDDSIAHVYYDYYRLKLQDTLDRFFTPEEQTLENLIQHTNVASIWFSLEEGAIMATFDYRLLPDASDAILVIRFNHKKQIVEVALEN